MTSPLVALSHILSNEVNGITAHTLVLVKPQITTDGYFL